MAVDVEITVSEMLATIAKAHLAEGKKKAQSIVDEVRHLSPRNLVAEYEWAVAVLIKHGLLTEGEQHRVAQYAQNRFDVAV